MNYQGIIIEESLENANVLKEIDIIKTKIEPVTEKHQTPYLKQWTLHTIEIPEEKAQEIAKKISESLSSAHNDDWYADFKNDKTYYIIFKNKVFQIDRANKEQYEEAKQYGISIGIPEYQVNFAKNTIE